MERKRDGEKKRWGGREMGRKRDGEEERWRGREMGRKRGGVEERWEGRESIWKRAGWRGLPLPVYRVFHYPAISVMGKMCSYQRDNTHTQQYSTVGDHHIWYGPSHTANLKRAAHN